MCLFNEHMADKHWYVLQKNVEIEAKVEYKKSFLFYFIFVNVYSIYFLGLWNVS